MIRAAALVSCDQCCGRHRPTPGPLLGSLGPSSARDLQHGGISHHVSIGRLRVAIPVVCKAGGATKFGAQKGIESKLLGAALGHGEKLGAAVARSVEAVRFWLGGGRGGGGGDSGNGGGGCSWGDGDMAPDTNSGAQLFAHEEEDDDRHVEEPKESIDARSSPLSNLDADRKYFCSGLEVINVEGMVSYFTLLQILHLFRASQEFLSSFSTYLELQEFFFFFV
jgi:hypothetical protein